MAGRSSQPPAVPRKLKPAVVQTADKEVRPTQTVVRTGSPAIAARADKAEKLESADSKILSSDKARQVYQVGSQPVVSGRREERVLVPFGSHVQTVGIDKCAVF